MAKIHGVHRTTIQVATIGAPGSGQPPPPQPPPLQPFPNQPFPPPPPPGAVPEVQWRTPASSVAEGFPLIPIYIDSDIVVPETVVITFVITGGADRGVDYELREGPLPSSNLISGSTITIFGGRDEGVIYLEALTDTPTSPLEGDETVIFTLQEDPNPGDVPGMARDESGDTITEAFGDGEEIEVAYTLGTGTVHTTTIEDNAGGNQTITWQFEDSSVFEGDDGSGNILGIFINLSNPGLPTTAASVEVVFVPVPQNGPAQIESAILGVHYDILTPGLTTGQGTYSFLAGQTSERISIRTIGDDDFNIDRYFDIHLSDPTNASLGSITVHRVRIRNDDAAAGIPSVSWSTSGPLQILEGTSNVNLTIIATTPSGTHPGFTVDIIRGGSAQNYVGAGPGTGTGHVTLPPINQVTFDPDQTSATYGPIQFPVNGVQEVIPHSLTLELSPVTPGVNLGTYPTWSTQIIGQGGGNPAGIDGVNTGYDGSVLFPERQPFDNNPNNADIWMHPGGIQIMTDDGASGMSSVAGITGTGGNGTFHILPTPSNSLFWGTGAGELQIRDVYSLAMFYASFIWRARYEGQGPGPSGGFYIGQENSPVTIYVTNQRHVLSAPEPSGLSIPWEDPLRPGTERIGGRNPSSAGVGGSVGNGGQQIGDSPGVALAWAGANVDNGEFTAYINAAAGVSGQTQSVVRDLVFFDNTEFELPVGEGLSCRSGPLRIKSTAFSMDNVRFERIRIGVVPSGFMNNSGFNPGANLFCSSMGYDNAFGSNRRQINGRVKFYDCQFRAYSDTNFNTSSYNVLTPDPNSDEGKRRRQQCFQWLSRACLDIRHQLAPHTPIGDDFQQHVFYLNGTIDAESYDYMTIDGTPQSSGGVPFGGCLVNLKNGNRRPGARTFVQNPWRGLNPSLEGAVSSGNYAIVRCTSTNYGPNTQEQAVFGPLTAYTTEAGGQAFTIHGTKGRIYFLDCVAENGNALGTEQGGLGIFSEPNFNGAPVFEFETDRFYCSKELVVDGFTFDMQNPNGTRTPMSFRGIETIRMIRFDMRSAPNISGAQISMNRLPHGQQGGTRSLRSVPGQLFTKEFDVSSLAHPDNPRQLWPVDEFGSYPGWRPNESYIEDGYWENWWAGHQSGSNAENAAEFVASHQADAYPSQPDSSGIIDEQYTNRLAATGTGRGTISNTSWPLNPSTEPLLPDIMWAKIENDVRLNQGDDPHAESFVVEAPVGETHTVYRDVVVRGGGSMCKMVIRWSADTSTFTANATANIPGGHNWFSHNSANLIGPQDTNWTNRHAVAADSWGIEEFAPADVVAHSWYANSSNSNKTDNIYQDRGFNTNPCTLRSSARYPHGLDDGLGVNIPHLSINDPSGGPEDDYETMTLELGAGGAVSEIEMPKGSGLYDPLRLLPAATHTLNILRLDLAPEVYFANQSGSSIVTLGFGGLHLQVTLEDSIEYYGSGSSTVVICDRKNAGGEFIDDGVLPGDTVTNLDTGATATVVSVDSQIQLTTTTMGSGGYSFGDELSITRIGFQILTKRRAVTGTPEGFQVVCTAQAGSRVNVTTPTATFGIAHVQPSTFFEDENMPMQGTDSLVWVVLDALPVAGNSLSLTFNTNTSFTTAPVLTQCQQATGLSITHRINFA